MTVCSMTRSKVKVKVTSRSRGLNFLKSWSQSPAKRGLLLDFYVFIAVLYNFCATGLDIY